VQHWFDPTSGQDTTPPDYRFTLANERTYLAWIRTALALVGGGLAIAAFVPRWPVVRNILAVALLVLGAVVTLRAVNDWSRRERAIWQGQPLPVSRFPAILALIVAAGAVALGVLVVVGLR
jgi:inner membrane protein YidH